jgi:hypothetical protein
MDKEEIIRMAREAGLAYGSDEKPLGSVIRFAALAVAEKEKQIIAANAPEIERINTYIKELEESVAATEREKVAAWMMAQGYATGHGDTVEDLLKELEWQIRESEREACAAICDSFQARDVGMQPAECAGAIRARGEQ